MGAHAYNASRQEAEQEGGCIKFECSTGNILSGWLGLQSKSCLKMYPRIYNFLCKTHPTSFETMVPLLLGVSVITLSSPVPAPCTDQLTTSINMS